MDYINFKQVSQPSTIQKWQCGNCQSFDIQFLANGLLCNNCATAELPPTAPNINSKITSEQAEEPLQDNASLDAN